MGRSGPPEIPLCRAYPTTGVPPSSRGGNHETESVVGVDATSCTGGGREGGVGDPRLVSAPVEATRANAVTTAMNAVRSRARGCRCCINSARAAVPSPCGSLQQWLWQAPLHPVKFPILYCNTPGDVRGGGPLPRRRIAQGRRGRGSPPQQTDARRPGGALWGGDPTPLPLSQTDDARRSGREPSLPSPGARRTPLVRRVGPERSARPRYTRAPQSEQGDRDEMDRA